jgi:hypothetical protein
MTARRFPPPWSFEVTPDLLHCLSVAKGRLPAAFGQLDLHTNCPGCIRVGDLIPLRKKEEGAMKALALLTAAAVTLFSVAASAQTYGAPYGKGKAPPPPPVVTKG